MAPDTAVKKVRTKVTLTIEVDMIAYDTEYGEWPNSFEVGNEVTNAVEGIVLDASKKGLILGGVARLVVPK